MSKLKDTDRTAFFNWEKFKLDHLYLLATLFSGAFVCNSIPHLTAGLRGERFPSPFASPPGKGKSSSVVNVLWGTANLAAGCLLWAGYPFSFGLNLATLAYFAGFVLIGAPMAKHFQAVRDADEAKYVR